MNRGLISTRFDFRPFEPFPFDNRRMLGNACKEAIINSYNDQTYRHCYRECAPSDGESLQVANDRKDACLKHFQKPFHFQYIKPNQVDKLWSMRHKQDDYPCKAGKGYTEDDAREKWSAAQNNNMGANSQYQGNYYYSCRN